MNWYRLMRAVEAEHIEAAEAKRTAMLSKEIKESDITSREWAIINGNDALLE